MGALIFFRDAIQIYPKPVPIVCVDALPPTVNQRNKEERDSPVDKLYTGLWISYQQGRVLTRSYVGSTFIPSSERHLIVRGKE